MNVRSARDSDLPNLVALVNRAFQVEQFFLIGDRLDVEHASRYIDKGRFLLAEEAGVLGGCIYVELHDDRAYFGLLSVDPRQQKHGIGRQLVRAAEEFAWNAGARYMDLTVVNLRTELPAFYEKLGYTVTGVEPAHEELARRVNQPCHLIRMSKSLDCQ